MATKYFRNKMSSVLQLYNLKTKYKCLDCSLKNGKLIWKQLVKPSIYSKEYIITLEYDGYIPSVYLYNQGIVKNNNEKIPHCFEQYFESKKGEYVKICLFYPKYNEWTNKSLLSKTIIPWTIEWLKYYELWRITGKWLGGGIEYENN